MQPHYATVSSSGGTNHSPWQLVDLDRNPINIGLSVQSSGGNYQIDVTCDDPTGIYPNPTLNSSVAFPGGQSFAANVTTFLSSQAGGGGIPAAAVNGIGQITQAIAAFRLTSTSSTPGGTITLSWEQAGPR